MAAADGIFFDYDGQNGNGQQYSQSQQDAQSQHPRMPSWPPLTSTQHQHTQGMSVPTSPPQMNMNAYKRSSSPLPLAMGQQHPYQDASVPAGQLIDNWQMGNVQMPPVTLGIDTGAGLQPSNFGSYGEMSFAVSPHDMMSQQQQAAAFMNQNANLNLDQNLEQDLLESIGISHQGLDVNNLAMNTSMPMDPPFMNVTSGLHMSNLGNNWHPVDRSLIGYEGIDVTTGHAFPQTHTLSVGSPSDPASDIEVKSQSSSENSSWTWVDNLNPPPTVFNPMAALHHRSPSDSSSDLEQPARTSIDSLDGYIDVGRQLNSPSESGPDSVYSDQGLYPNSHKPSPPPAILTAAASRAKQSVRKSPTSPTDRNNFKVTKPASNKAQPTISKANRSRSGTTGTGEEKKRVGKRKGPLRPEQRKQASEIRKLGACIRCRFLKKTCDKGDPCAGCQPSHARLWLVPCTRVDIKDLGYFLKGWNADYERHVTLNVSVANLKGFGEHEKQLMVTHGYGHYLPIKAREVYVHDESVFGVDWIEAHSGTHEEFKVDTARLSIGMEGISPKILSEYLDMHIDGGFEFFVDEHFQGTPFVTEMLKIAYRFYTKEKTPQVRKALKLVLAYNLTQAILLVRGFGAEEEIEGKIEDSRSEFIGETAAPMMINFKIKAAMAEMWRDLQKSLLEDLSQLYSSIYTGDKLKHWPTIFMVASVLLVVWEEMQFDCRYRVPDEKLVDKFCNDMEVTPVGVIVGLFSAISQKVPSFSEWDTSKHHALLRSNPSVCEAMESVRDGIKKHDKYLRGRSQAKFDRNDFDSLSNMFVSKLVIRAH